MLSSYQQLTPTAPLALPSCSLSHGHCCWAQPEAPTRARAQAPARPPLEAALSRGRPAWKTSA